MVSRFAVPELLSEELVSVASEAFRNPRVLFTVEQALIERRAELEKLVNKFARSALVDPSHGATALRYEGRLAEVDDLIEKITRWKE